MYDVLVLESSSYSPSVKCLNAFLSGSLFLSLVWLPCHLLPSRDTIFHGILHTELIHWLSAGWGEPRQGGINRGRWGPSARDGWTWVLSHIPATQVVSKPCPKPGLPWAWCAKIKFHYVKTQGKLSQFQQDLCICLFFLIKNCLLTRGEPCNSAWVRSSCK